MKTYEQIERKIESLMSIGITTSDSAEKKRIRKQLAFIRPISRYLLLVNPTKEIVERDLSTSLMKKKRIEEEFEYIFPVGIDAKTGAAWKKGKGYPQLKKQIKTLQYILDEEK